MTAAGRQTKGLKTWQRVLRCKEKGRKVKIFFVTVDKKVWGVKFRMAGVAEPVWLCLNNCSVYCYPSQ